ncbi:MAG: CHAD domain-containing protein [Planctomycetes bacterium]|nr:CHAD domain-containing protein [Planctomycetota bacterium]
MKDAQEPAEELLPRRTLAHLEAHLAVARDGEDPEGVHQVRVASARLETFLRLSSRRALRDDLRWLRERASAVRDLDVLLAGRLPKPFAEWLAAERVVARAGLIEALESPRLRALLDAWNWVPPLDRKRAAHERRRLARRATVRAASALAADATLDAFHAVRRALRRLRYAEEWLRRDASELKALQQSLGELNDVAVVRRYFAACPRAPECGEFAAELEHELARRVAKARLVLARAYPRADDRGPKAKSRARPR